VNQNTSIDNSYTSCIRDIRLLLKQRRAKDAATASHALAELYPDKVEPLLLLGKARQQQARFEDMLELAAAALELDPRHRGAQLQFAESSIFCGRHDCALQQLADLEAEAGNDANLLQHIAEYYVQLGKHKTAHRCYLRAVELEPDSSRCLYNLAASYVAVGDLDAAEKTFTQVVEANPNDFDAWQNRSNLRRQSPASNHIADLATRLNKLHPGDPGEVALCYALAKEYEDLGEYDASFLYLKRGADGRRKRMSYDVAGDVAIMGRIAATFDESSRAPMAAPRAGPIFVLGLPRSGTTLVDRILSSHSQVQSLGEINDFALCLTRLGKASGKNELLEASLAIDADALGAAYVDSVANYGRDSRYFIDKTPANFLYIGLIARSLPASPIVHLHRHPVDSCLAMYRTLFRMGYPFSYDLNDLAEYYIGYRRLMEHWHRLLPGRILDVSYEALVDSQVEQSRRLSDYCGLNWESACLHFDRNSAPVATASAAQVRQPIYRDAVARWRKYEKHLAPLLERLQSAGIAID
jgi:tetratricopeptide (TPR) repeat protein